jgi:crotonobetainyl-CoA:carnitine CoA-transferase CaiB-like acyl-CoA transferase
MTEGKAMYDLLEGVRVVELSSWLLLPSTGVLLADWGASVLKIEPVKRGDPARGLVHGRVQVATGPQPMFEVANRGKRSIGLDVSSEEGRAVLHDLIREADVFTTNLWPSARAKLRVDYADVAAINPAIVYVGASGYGTEGPESARPAFDLAASWSAGGASYAMTLPGAEAPAFQAASFGDLTGALAASGAVAAALFRRERTGQGSQIDIALLAIGMWMMGPAIAAASLGTPYPVHDRRNPANPLVNGYPTSDDRWIFFCYLQSDPYWAGFCEHIDRRELIDDERFADSARRGENSAALREILDEVFVSRSLAEWQQKFDDLDGVWSPALSPHEVLAHEQARVNGFVSTLGDPSAAHQVVASPAQFDRAPLGPVARSPEHGQHTEEALLEIGYSWERILELKERDVIL